MSRVGKKMATSHVMTYGHKHFTPFEVQDTISISRSYLVEVRVEKN